MTATAKAVRQTDLRFVSFPWDCVLHDNHRFVPAAKRRGLVLSPEYRDAKEKAVSAATQQLIGKRKLSGDVALIAHCYFPDKRKRDAGNYRKLITDALTGLAYDDDSQIAEEYWSRIGVDRSNPRIEVALCISPLLRTL